MNFDRNHLSLRKLRIRYTIVVIWRKQDTGEAVVSAGQYMRQLKSKYGGIE